jgi:hypothetical protein
MRGQELTRRPTAGFRRWTLTSWMQRRLHPEGHLFSVQGLLRDPTITSADQRRINRDSSSGHFHAYQACSLLGFNECLINHLMR